MNVLFSSVNCDFFPISQSDIDKEKTRTGGLIVTLGPKCIAAGYEGILVN
jgi:hypothetical protein